MSGIYLRGLQMPKDGERLCIDIHPEGKVSINLDLKCRQIAKAFPVPDHGRLIDADKLRESLFIGEQCIYSWDEIDNAIDYAPTVLPVDKEAPT